jgi:hypothetical protein
MTTTGKPKAKLTQHTKDAMTFWTVMADVNVALTEAGQLDNARAFRTRAQALFDPGRDDEDNLADLYDLAFQYVEVA